MVNAEGKIKNREKVFKDRDSLLTIMMKINHFKTIKNFFYALLLTYFLKEILISLSQPESSSFGFSLLKKGFYRFDLGFILWIAMFLFSLSAAPLFKFWAYVRTKISPIAFTKKSWDLVAASIVITYYIYAIYCMPFIIKKLKLGLLTATVLHLENVRFVMKTHSFIRNNAPTVLKYKQHSDETLNLPQMSNYLYFSFAPTLIYRDEYPKRKKVDVRFAVKRFFEFFLTVWLLTLVFEKCYWNVHRDAGLVKIDWINCILMMLDNYLAGMFVFVSIFYVLLHNWYNGVAEILRFADRNFYTEWWIATDFSIFYRKWNTPVQDWLHQYIYKEFKDNVMPGNNFLPKCLVFFISSLMHEFIILNVLRQYFPLMFFIMFILAAPLTYVKNTPSYLNIYFIFAQGFGTTLMIHLYSVEYYAQLNCPIPANVTILQYIPRIFTADCF